MSRRTPLSNIPNAINSTFGVTGTGAKRSRSQSTLTRDTSYGQPPSKKAIIEAPPVKRSNVENAVTTTPRRVPVPKAEYKRPTKARSKPAEVETTITDITQWKVQYGGMFPKYKFYIEHYHPYVVKKAMEYIMKSGGVISCRIKKCYRDADTLLGVYKCFRGSNTLAYRKASFSTIYKVT